MQEHIFFLTIHLTSFAHIRPHHILLYSSQQAVRGLSTMADPGEGPKGGLGSPLFWVKKESCRRKKRNKKPGPPP